MSEMEQNILGLVPVTYFKHIFEEIPCFITWTNKYLFFNMNFPRVILRNCIFMKYVLLSVFMVISYREYGLLYLGWQ